MLSSRWKNAVDQEPCQIAEYIELTTGGCPLFSDVLPNFTVIWREKTQPKKFPGLALFSVSES
jgi:hypothetical protein